MASWTDEGNTYTAKVNGYTLTVTRLPTGQWRYVVSNGLRIMWAGDAQQLEVAKFQAERDVEKLG